MKNKLKKSTNKIFDQLKIQFGIDKIEKIDVALPKDVKELLNEKIAITKYGITLNCWKDKLGKPAPFETVSIIEDNANHFHVDQDALPKNEETAFKLGIKTAYLLCQKFESNGFSDIQISYSFHTKEMSKQMDKDQNIKIENVYYFGDRISFNQIRKGEELRGNLEDFKCDAILILETE